MTQKQLDSVSDLIQATVLCLMIWFLAKPEVSMWYIYAGWCTGIFFRMLSSEE